jgi:tRNA G37 N-methylase Trm5
MNPFERIKSKIRAELGDKLPKKWKKIGDVLIVDFYLIPKEDKDEIAEIYANELKVKTIIQKKKINGELRKPKRTELLYGNDTITKISEYGLTYNIDLSEIMWSPGNTGWRSALAGPEKVSDFYSFDNPKTIIDYFAGIGYFALQIAKGYSESKVVAIDKNLKSIGYLKINAKENNIDNIEIINDDCRNIQTKADVIHLGYIGNTVDFLEHTHNSLKNNGIAIFHEAYRNNWLGFKSRSDWGGVPDNFSELMNSKGFNVEKFERVKFYGPSKSHIIAILRKI